MTPKIKKGVKIRHEEFGALIFTNRTPILTLNHDALMIWNLIDGKKSTDDIVDIIQDNQALDSARVAFSVNEFIKSCVELDLVETE